jgi:hypothetical protein
VALRLTCASRHVTTVASRCCLIDNELLNPTDLIRERELMSSLDHPLLPRLYSTFKDVKYVYFLMDLYSGGTLEEAQALEPGKVLTPAASRYYMASIVSMCECRPGSSRTPAEPLPHARCSRL